MYRGVPVTPINQDTQVRTSELAVSCFYLEANVREQITREEYLKRVEDGLLIDYDGYGIPGVLVGEEVHYHESKVVYPSEGLEDWVTHVAWVNR